MSISRLIYDWYCNRHPDVKVLIIATLIIAPLAAIVGSNRLLATPVMGPIGIYSSAILTAALVALYYNQTAIQRRQTEIMEFHKKVEEADLAPKLYFRPEKVSDGFVHGELRNNGTGIATDIQFRFRRMKNGKRSSVGNDVLDESGNFVGVLRPDEKILVKFEPHFPSDVSSDPKPMTIDDLCNDVPLNEDETMQCRIYATNVAGNEVDHRTRRTTEELESLEQFYNLD